MCIEVWVSRGSEANLRFQSLPSTLFEAGWPVVCCEAFKASSWHFCLLSHCRGAGLTDVHYCIQLNMASGDLNSDLHTCSQPTESSSQATEVRICWYSSHGQDKTTERIPIMCLAWKYNLGPHSTSRPTTVYHLDSCRHWQSLRHLQAVGLT